MGSLRNPIGPLPSSIYWRRRAVALSLIALLAVLIAWALSTSGGNAGKGDDSANGATPAPSITPGPSQSGPAISEQPGGRDESGDSGTGDGGTDEGGTGTGSDGGAGGEAGAGGGNGAGGAGSGGAGGQQVPASSKLPDCAPGALKLTLRSAKVAYAPGEKPTFQLVASNSSGTTCKADFGPRAAVLTVKDDKDDKVWSSKDCPRAAGSLLLRVPAGATITHSVEWDRKQSAPQCATPPAGLAGAGTYLVEAEYPGVTVLPASFRLEKD
ncbi:hypothetical protein OG729_17405 [Streptomyces sp. NBC_00210]|uniref:hypothetical protein n=1 Tax=unclassified Streptomyces TaxID=2593676 RepID=UPI00325576F4